MPDRVRPLRIGLYCDRWPTFHPMHGPARYVATLAEGLAASGIETHVFTAEPGPARALPERGYTLHTCATQPLRILSRWQPGIGESRAIAHAIRTFHATAPFDVLEFTNVEGVGFWSARFPVCPTVIRVHTTAFDALRLGVGHSRLERGYARLERWTAHHATCLVTHTASHRTGVARDYGVAASDIRLIPHGIRPETASGPPLARRDDLVLSVGAASPRKGVSEFLAIAATVGATHPSVRFLWVGQDAATAPGGTSWAAHAEAAYPALRGRVTFRADLSDGELAALYREATCYLCTARYESFGLTLVEAMAAGLPVVAPGTSAMAELIQDDLSGRLYPAADPVAAAHMLCALLDRPDERERLGAAARVRARSEYSASTMVDRMIALYRECVRE